MKKRKSTANTGIRNKQLFCFNCGESQKIPFPLSIPMLTAMAKQFKAEHANCLPNWKHPEVDQSLPVIEKAKWWLEDGEHGLSSETIFSILAPKELLPIMNEWQYTHPKDPDDFRRCYLLIEKTIPEWKPRLELLRKLSPQWRKIVDNWDRLCWLLEEQLGGKHDQKLWNYMKELGC